MSEESVTINKSGYVKCPNCGKNDQTYYGDIDTSVRFNDARAGMNGYEVTLCYCKRCTKWFIDDVNVDFIACVASDLEHDSDCSYMTQYELDMHIQDKRDGLF